MTEAEFTEDKIEEGFFGSGKVAMKKGMNDMANYMAARTMSKVRRKIGFVELGK